MDFAQDIEPLRPSEARRRDALLLVSFALSLGLHLAAGAALLYRTPSPGTPHGAPEAISVSLVPSTVFDAAGEQASVQQEAAPSAAMDGAEPVKRRENAENAAKPLEAQAETPPSDAKATAAEPETSPAPPVLTARDEQVEDAVPEPAAEERKPPQPEPKRQASPAPKDKAKQRKQTPPRQRQAAASGRGASAESGQVSASLGSLTDYAAMVRARFARHKPGGLPHTGTAKVAFAISPGGALTYARLAQSSGSAALDAAAIRAVRAAAPFPPPPGGRTFASVIPFDSR